MVRRKKKTSLSAAEIERFVLDARRLHNTICAPLISPYCEHQRALRKLNDAIHLAVEEVTGRQAPWLTELNTAPQRTPPD
jgi:hypothetical protein